MKLIAGFQVDVWSMHLAYVDKLAQDYRGLNFFLFLQDLFNRTVVAKRMTTKDSNENVRAFLNVITEQSRPKIIGLTSGHNLLEISKIFAAPKECKFTLQLVRIKLHLLIEHHCS